MLSGVKISTFIPTVFFSTLAYQFSSLVEKLVLLLIYNYTYCYNIKLEVKFFEAIYGNYLKNKQNRLTAVMTQSPRVSNINSGFEIVPPLCSTPSMLGKRGLQIGRFNFGLHLVTLFKVLVMCEDQTICMIHTNTSFQKFETIYENFLCNMQIQNTKYC